MDIMYKRSDGTTVKMLVTAAYFEDGDIHAYLHRNPFGVRKLILHRNKIDSKATMLIRMRSDTLVVTNETVEEL